MKYKESEIKIDIYNKLSAKQEFVTYKKDNSHGIAVPMRYIIDLLLENEKKKDILEIGMVAGFVNKVLARIDSDLVMYNKENMVESHAFFLGRIRDDIKKLYYKEFEKYIKE